MTNNTQMEKEFAVRFKIVEGNIETQMKQKNVSPQEAIGLLEMAKSQLLENLSKNRKDIFSGTFKE